MKEKIFFCLIVALILVFVGCSKDEEKVSTPVYSDISKTELESVPSFKYDNLYIKFRNGYLITQQIASSMPCNQDTMPYTLSGSNIKFTFTMYFQPTEYSGTIQKITQEGEPNKLYMMLNQDKQVGVWLSNTYEWCDSDFKF